MSECGDLWTVSEHPGPWSSVVPSTPGTGVPRVPDYSSHLQFTNFSLFIDVCHYFWSFLFSRYSLVLSFLEEL